MCHKATFTFRKAGDVCYTPPLGEAMVEASLGAGAGVDEKFQVFANRPYLAVDVGPVVSEKHTRFLE